MKKVIQKDIAERLGVDITTVSKALKGHPAVAKKTKAVVLKTADEMGYKQDPMLRALSGYRRTLRPAKQIRAAIAWIEDHSSDTAMKRLSDYPAYFKGAQKRASSLGYHIEKFRLGRGGYSAERLAQILKARGITGVIIAPLRRPEGVIDLPWETLSAVAIGYTLQSPQLHVFTNDHFHTMTTLLEKLKSMGRRTIGVHIWKEDNLRTRKRTIASFQTWGKSHASPLMVYTKPNQKAALDWCLKYKLDAVITRENQFEDWLRESGYRVPQDVLLASHAHDANTPVGWHGMNHNNAEVSATAMEWLAAMIERGEKGIPDLPKRILVTGTWV